MNNIGFLHDCYGCGVCSVACPRGVISISLNENGFYKAIVSDGGCINCGICNDICACLHKEISVNNTIEKSWAAWSNDDRVRRKCSSGGIGFEIGKQLIEQGYKAVGCRYNVEGQRAEHFIASTVDDFIPSIGSKYIQSYTGSAFNNIDFSKRYLVIGTPCQIDSFRRLIRKRHCEDNFVLMDFFCHCVPSMLSWKAYVRMVESKIGKITFVSWRNKFQYGWHDSWLMGIDGDEAKSNIDPVETHADALTERVTTYQSRKSQGDLFYKLFLGDVCAGPQCSSECKYKMNHSAADIRIGDLWGNKYKDDQKGVSALAAFTEKGRSVIESLHDVSLQELPFDVVAEGQMKQNLKPKELTPVVMWLLKHEKPLDGFLFSMVFSMQRVITKIKRLLKI